MEFWAIARLSQDDKGKVLAIVAIVGKKEIVITSEILTIKLQLRDTGDDDKFLKLVMDVEFIEQGYYGSTKYATYEKKHCSAGLKYLFHAIMHCLSDKVASSSERFCPKTGLPFIIPDVSKEIKPQMDMIFTSLDDCYSMYVTYAKACGFLVRNETAKINAKGEKHIKYYMCMRARVYKDKKVDTLDPNQKERLVRSNFSKRTDCGALLCVIFEVGSWKVYKFVEEHNHDLVERPDKHFLPTERHLTQLPKHVIHNMSKLNLGPVKAFNVMKTCFGGFEDVSASKVEFKNYKRQINLFIGEYDAEMVVRHLDEKKTAQPNFSYDYFTDEDNRLKGLFWCDDQAKRNYHVFGDVISFDATYAMVFVPFTGIDNDHCNVTFGVALLASEIADTYIWLLRVFLKVVGSQPKVVVTDQDPAMKKAISALFVDTRHRLCMWESWIPAYYRMEELSGLMRTISRTESENHFFGQVCNSKATLVEFMTHYETAIEA
ncbi:protein FAR1-RELATED SEQUENCE 5-like [Helianthus annuus]|uniref:protein FAR1-RELATED SEQUENCE 5-like n=1 Tax=Helianthus annuus TaxID=4232 RepID=UPI001652F929|nr:protein FAR1-RELATED SEQUENCE 5-like [Helianthus annuus]